MSMDDRVLLTRAQAAMVCNVSLRSFERHVQPHLPVVHLGNLVRYFRDDVIRWLEQRRDASATPRALAPVPQLHAQPPARLALSPRAQEILKRLRAK